MTALEWAIIKGGTKMIELFFVHGATPDTNAFNGVMTIREMFTQRTTVFEGFDSVNPRPIKGFPGLKVLVKETDIAAKFLL